MGELIAGGRHARHLPRVQHPLIVIDNRGEHLVGCLSCNLWCDRDGNAVRLSEEDLAALQALRT